MTSDQFDNLYSGTDGILQWTTQSPEGVEMSISPKIRERAVMLIRQLRPTLVDPNGIGTEFDNFIVEFRRQLLEGISLEPAILSSFCLTLLKRPDGAKEYYLPVTLRAVKEKCRGAIVPRSLIHIGQIFFSPSRLFKDTYEYEQIVLRNRKKPHSIIHILSHPRRHTAPIILIEDQLNGGLVQVDQIPPLNGLSVFSYTSTASLGSIFSESLFDH